MPRDGTLPEMPPPDPLQTLLVQEWQAISLGQQHLADAINKVIEAWQQDRKALVILEAELLTKIAKITELEAKLDELTTVEPL